MSVLGRRCLASLSTKDQQGFHTPEPQQQASVWRPIEKMYTEEHPWQNSEKQCPVCKTPFFWVMEMDGNFHTKFLFEGIVPWEQLLRVSASFLPPGINPD